MKLIIAGSRTLRPSLEFIESSILMLKPYKNGHITEVVCGGAEGVDQEGAHWTSHRQVPVKYFRANWKEKGRVAGPMRNREMARYADALLLIWDGKSRGSANMKKEAKEIGIPIYEVLLKR